MQVQKQNTHDTDIYNYIISKEKLQMGDIQAKNTTTAFLTHVMFKGIIMMLFYFQQIFDELASEIVTGELTVIFVIVDFWFTKNINGRRLVGLRWFFGEDKYGIQRFMYEARINDQYLNAVNSKLFWIVCVVFLIVPIVDLSTTIVIAPNLYRVNFGKVLINLIVISGGMSNLFLFYKANSAATAKILEFKRIYGYQFCRKLGPNSIVSAL